MLRRMVHAAGSAVLVAPLPAYAHHAMGGEVAQTVWQGFVSGLAHPVLGPDHLAFLLAAGVLAAALPRLGPQALGVFLLTGLIGALLHLSGAGLGPVETVVALSVVLVGAALLAPRWRSEAFGPDLVATGFALAGLFHGHAFAEAVAGARTTVLVAHLVALVAAQAALGFGAMAIARRVAAAWAMEDAACRAAGALAVAAGAVTLAAAVLA